jgi:hypothetical protein
VRPALPNNAPGSSSQGTKAAKSKFSLSASSVPSVLDQNSFDFKLGAAAKDESAKLKKDKEPQTDLAENGLTVEWEAWHKRLSSNIYDFWLQLGKVPGEGTVVLRITKTGDISSELKDFHVNPLERISHEQRELFERSVSRTIQRLAHQNVLDFPAKSQRQEVVLSTKFAYSDLDNQRAPGYTWKQGDVEQLNR